MKVCFIWHRTIEKAEKLKFLLRETIVTLICPIRRNSGTKIAYKYAQKKGKENYQFISVLKNTINILSGGLGKGLPRFRYKNYDDSAYSISAGKTPFNAYLPWGYFIPKE